MKIAVIYCGQPRNFSNAIYENHYSHIFSKYDCDIYAHFWLDDTNTCDTYATWLDKKALHIRSDIKDAFNVLCKPKCIVFDKPLDKSVCGDMSVYTRTSAYGVVYNLHSMYTSLKNAYLLIDDIYQYDYIIRLRTDLIIHNLCELNENIQCVTYHDQINKGIDNAIWISPIKYASKMCSIIDNLYELYNSGTYMNDEQMFYAHIQKEQLFNNIQFGKVTYAISR